MSSTTRNRNRILLALICFVSFCLRLGSVGLFDFNEGFYAQVSREMALRSDYITPRVNGLFFFDKPPFALWQSAISMKLFGATEFAARFPVAMAAICLVIAVYWFGAKFFSERAGLFAAAIVAMNPMMIGTARQLTMDIHQTLWFAVAMMAFFIGYQG
ncbi:MAG: glycosyltransferase family 39 protein, partial [Chthonomonadales bacterium]